MFPVHPFRGLLRGPLLSFLLLALLPPPATRAQAVTPLTLADAVRRTRESHPAVRGAEHDLAAARAIVRDARRRPEPVIAGAYENFAGSLGADRAEATITVEQVFELGGDRAARHALAEAGVGLATADLAIIRNESEAATVEAFLEAWGAQERAGRLREAVRDADSATTAAAERHRVGAAPVHEALRARADRALRQVEFERAERDLSLARDALARPWGVTPESLGTLVLPEDGAYEAPAREALVAHLDAQPGMRRAAAQRARHEAALREARARRKPDLTLGAGARHLAESASTGFVATVSFPLPWSGAGQGAVAAAEAERSASIAQSDMASARVLHAASAAYERFTSALASRREVRETALPAADQAMRSLDASFRSGRSSYLEVQAGQRALLEARLLDLELTVEVWKARLELERWRSAPAEADHAGGGR